MSRPLRFIPDEYKNWTDSYGRDIAVVEITIRTVLGMFLLKPTPQNRSIIVGVMAHVQQRLKFRTGFRTPLESDSTDPLIS